MNLIHEGRKEGGRKKRDLVNITYLRKKLQELYSEKDRTGLLNSRNIEDTIETMEEIGLIIRERRGKQEKPIKLSPLGEDTLDFILSLDKYNDAYFNLYNSYSKKLLFISASHLEFMNMNDKSLNSCDLGKIKEDVMNYKKKLIQNGWNKIEIILYNEIRSNLIDLKIVCDKTFLNILLLRYAKIIKEYNIRNPLILRFFSYLIKVSIEKKVDFIISNYEMEVNGYSDLRIISPVNTELVRSFDIIQADMHSEDKFYPKINEYVISRGTTGGESEYFMDIYNIFYDKTISFSLKNEIREMITSYIELLQIHLGNYDRYLDGLKQIIIDLESKIESEPDFQPIEKDKINLVKETTKFFLTLLVEYARRNNMEIVTFNLL